MDNLALYLINFVGNWRQTKLFKKHVLNKGTKQISQDMNSTLHLNLLNQQRSISEDIGHFFLWSLSINETTQKKSLWQYLTVLWLIKILPDNMQSGTRFKCTSSLEFLFCNIIMLLGLCEWIRMSLTRELCVVSKGGYPFATMKPIMS